MQPGAPPTAVLTGDSGLDTAAGLAAGWCMLPHPEKAHKGGEDAVFTEGSVIGVADGVGGWAAQGVDPGLYSKALMRAAAQAAAASELRDARPTDILRQAFDVVGSADTFMLICAPLIKEPRLSRWQRRGLWGRPRRCARNLSAVLPASLACDFTSTNAGCGRALR